MDQEVDQNEYVLLGREAICRFIGEKPYDIGRLVDEQDLPAWQANGKRSTWKAFKGDLVGWLKNQCITCRQKRAKKIVNNKIT